MDNFSFLGNADGSVIDEYYQLYLSNPESVDISWQKFFEGFEFARKNFEIEIPKGVEKEFKVVNLINGYRTRGHLFTKTNPVRIRRTYTPTLDIENFGLAPSDLETVFQAGNTIGIGPIKLKDIILHLKQTYCQSIGAEYMYIRTPEIIEWFQRKMESYRNTPSYSKEEKIEILNQLNKAVVFENFLHTKFVGQKRFSLEGAEAIIPALEAICEKGAESGVEDFVIGMAHRGRLNVLVNILEKQYKDIFTEFEGTENEDLLFDGDVKYHLGYTNVRKSKQGNKVYLSIAPNPSHLETVNAVVEGIARAKIDFAYNNDDAKVCPILIHGDAALAGQGVVYEVIQMSQLDGFKTGGTVHFVINNQVGFTTNYLDGRSSTYCTDIAKVVLSPVFHVNGDDVEALVYISQLAMEFRQRFHKDVFIDVLCYRKYGHNEGDEPRFTQPLLYKAIAAHANPTEIYSKQLISQGIIKPEFVIELEKSLKETLEVELKVAKLTEKVANSTSYYGSWTGLRSANKIDFEKSPETAIDKNLFVKIAQKISELPKDKKFFNKIQKLFNDRISMIDKDKYDWAMGELMAYASLLDEGHNVRFSGQDVERGTFSHRHAVVKVEDSEEEFIPLNNIGAKGKLSIYNSLLSEYGVLGFEFGYALTTPNSLTIWEAQFGDFYNGAQIIIDQYITSSEYKWRRMNGLVLLLPHGYEGMGPEHSSAHMERFLQQCAENNMQLVNCTTPANQFHVLRRQLKRDFRKPLICFTPKKLLRYPSCVSTLNDFTNGGFQEVIDDETAEVKKVKKLVFCSGKIYYDIIEEKLNLSDHTCAIIRIEQLYPLPKNQIIKLIEKYKSAREFIWAQEESENMGAWSFINYNFPTVSLKYRGRNESASTATGFNKMHIKQQKLFINSIFDN
jgi:2-oxoglutarate dehydrogenase E1 component